MEEHLFEKIPDLDRLLETRSFDDLTSREKEEILRYMKREDYDSYRETIIRSKMLFAAEEKILRADPAIRAKLLTRMKQRERVTEHGLSSFLRAMLTYRIPAYPPAFAIAVLAIFFFLLYNEKPGTIQYLTKTDTIYMEKKTTRNESTGTMQGTTMKAGKSNGQPGQTTIREKPATARPGRHIPSRDQFVTNAYQKIEFAKMSKRGSNASDDSALMKFLVTAN